MAERRMFTKKITDSDAFLDMPASAQALYFHLNMHADDDGFVNSPKSIQRTVGASIDDIKLLLAKKFILSFESGVIVIKHWKMHNYLRTDRYKPTDYKEELAQLSLDEKKAYSLDGYQMDTNGIPNGYIGKDRLGKDKIGKVSLGYIEAFPDDQKLNEAFNDYVAMRKKIKAPMTDRAIDLAIKKVMDLANNDNDVAIEILNRSVMNSWKGLFPLKETKQTGQIDWENV